MTPARARELIGAWAGRRVLLIGDLMMDEWVFGSVRRISPEAPIPVVNMPLTPEARADKPGGAGNVAAILLGLGAAVRVVGLVGDDSLGQRLTADLRGRGADVSSVLTDASRPTTHKQRILAGRQQLLRVDTESDAPIDSALAGRLRDAIRNGLAQADVVLVSDYAKGVVTAGSLTPEVIGEARKAGIPFCADPKPGNVDLFRGASLVSPNESEALEAAGLGAGFVNPADAGFTKPAPNLAAVPPHIAAAGHALKQRLEADAVFITRGDKGIAVFGPDDLVAQVPAAAGSGDVGDGTGCGDAVSAASALALAAGASYMEAAELANAAGGVVSRFVGVHSPTADEITDWLSRPQ
jgi:D-beta-D-heptose 7-phosphate kinase/D-beta-D-heptose 1-phosphate adenosyltransferase